MTQQATEEGTAVGPAEHCFTPAQRRVALQVQAIDVLGALGNSFAFPASLAVRMRMLGQDASLLAVLTGQVKLLNTGTDATTAVLALALPLALACTATATATATAIATATATATTVLPGRCHCQVVVQAAD